MPAVPPGQLAPVSSVDEAIARMELIGETTRPADGVACFNRMYLEVTRQVGHRLGKGFFADPDFMTRLDVTFANLYFSALDAARSPETVPLAWRPLVEQRANATIEPIQFALAGMNAHINHDLPLAVVSTCTELATTPIAGAHHTDFQKVDQLLDVAEQSVRQSFESAAERDVDSRVEAVADLVANWAINTARDLAWANALLLWDLRDDPAAHAAFVDGLAATAAEASRMLLVTV
jgi:hypothetical protein